MEGNANQSSQSAESTPPMTNTTSPQDPDPILQEFPEIRHAEEQQANQREAEQQQQAEQ